jgi:TPP-dependent indolepyruvate ferredoxin oxidoreductase alpha subunit
MPGRHSGAMQHTGAAQHSTGQPSHAAPASLPQAPKPFDWRTSTITKGVAVGAAAVLLGTLGMAVYRAYQKSTSARAQRKRTVSSHARHACHSCHVLPSCPAALPRPAGRQASLRWCCVASSYCCS